MSHCGIASSPERFGLYISYTDRLRNGHFDSEVWGDGLDGGGVLLRSETVEIVRVTLGGGVERGPLNVLLIEFGSYSM